MNRRDASLSSTPARDVVFAVAASVADGQHVDAPSGASSDTERPRDAPTRAGICSSTPRRNRPGRNRSPDTPRQQSHSADNSKHDRSARPPLPPPTPCWTARGRGRHIEPAEALLCSCRDVEGPGLEWYPVPGLRFNFSARSITEGFHAAPPRDRAQLAALRKTPGGALPWGSRETSLDPDIQRGGYPPRSLTRTRQKLFNTAVLRNDRATLASRVSLRPQRWTHSGEQDRTRFGKRLSTRCLVTFPGKKGPCSPRGTRMRSSWRAYNS